MAARPQSNSPRWSTAAAGSGPSPPTTSPSPPPPPRTRLAFDMAAKRLSADVISFDAASSSTTKGETLRDTAENIQALNADMIVIRHAAAGSPLYLSRILDIPVVNAGDGAHEHPTQ